MTTNYRPHCLHHKHRHRQLSTWAIHTSMISRDDWFGTILWLRSPNGCSTNNQNKKKIRMGTVGIFNEIQIANYIWVALQFFTVWNLGPLLCRLEMFGVLNRRHFHSNALRGKAIQLPESGHLAAVDRRLAAVGWCNLSRRLFSAATSNALASAQAMYLII